MLLHRHCGIKLTLKRVIEINNRFKVGPTQLSPRCGDNLFVGKNVGKFYAMSKLLWTPAFTKLAGK